MTLFGILFFFFTSFTHYELKTPVTDKSQEAPTPKDVVVHDEDSLRQLSSAKVVVQDDLVPNEDDDYIPNEDDDYVAEAPKIRVEADLASKETLKKDSIRESAELYDVVKVVDGDTVDVSIDGRVERMRLIGINTPETVDPRRPVQCFGIEASNKAKGLLEGQRVELESDSTQGERDKYGRLLRYIRLRDGRNFNELMISEGYAYEYTYNSPYKYQQEFKRAETSAREAKRGLWADSACAPSSVSVPSSEAGVCTIKGNISATGEKIYHVIGCAYYNKTTIIESAGEKWFCSEEDAIQAGWRKAQNC